MNAPEHKVTLSYSRRTFTVRCKICGTLGHYTKWVQAMARKSTHERGQDAGRELR